MTSTRGSVPGPTSRQRYKIVISWRRSCPSAGTVHRLYDRLAERYGKEVIFFDLETMREGNFPRQISVAISQASVLLVAVGRDWAGADGTIDRIINTKDWVFQEIRAAYELRKKGKEKEERGEKGGKKPIVLIPVLIDGATMPNHPELDEIPCLKHVKYNNAFPLTGDRDLTGVTKLIECLDTYVPPKKLKVPIVVVGCAALLLVAAGAFFMPNKGQPQHPAKEEPRSVAKKAEPSVATKKVETPPTAKSDNSTPATVPVAGAHNEVVTDAGRAAALESAAPELPFKNSLNMQFAYISAGEFIQGSEEGESDETPVKKRRITCDFHLQTTETTIGQVLVWLNDVRKCDDSWIDLSSFSCPIQRRGDLYVLKGADCKFGESQHQPMVGITWDGAQAFVQWLSQKEGRNYRLPWEAEWEYAARAGSKEKWCFGDDESRLGDYAWYEANSNDCTHSVGGKKSNAWGLFDMHGNVWEWCQDSFDEKYYSNSPVNDPFNSESGSFRVNRGGSWYDDAAGCRATRRGKYPLSADGNWYSGFRLAL